MSCSVGAQPKACPIAVQYKDGLNAAQWHDLAPDVTATADMVFFTNHPASPSMRYYRIMILPAAR